MSEIRNLTRNGETFYPLTCSDAVLNRDGEPLGPVNDIFDISEYNASGTPPVLAKYETLSLALAAVPTSKQKGGMTIRYVQTSDNKYVQCRLMNNQWSTVESDWQGTDVIPSYNSVNLVESGGVKNEILSIHSEVFESTDAYLFTIPKKHYRFRTSGFEYHLSNGCFKFEIHNKLSIPALSDGYQYILYKYISDNEGVAVSSVYRDDAYTPTLDGVYVITFRKYVDDSTVNLTDADYEYIKNIKCHILNGNSLEKTLNDRIDEVQGDTDDIQELLFDETETVNITIEATHRLGYYYPVTGGKHYLVNFASSSNSDLTNIGVFAWTDEASLGNIATIDLGETKEVTVPALATRLYFYKNLYVESDTTLIVNITGLADIPYRIGELETQVSAITDVVFPYSSDAVFCDNIESNVLTEMYFPNITSSWKIANVTITSESVRFTLKDPNGDNIMKRYCLEDAVNPFYYGSDIIGYFMLHKLDEDYTIASSSGFSINVDVVTNINNSPRIKEYLNRKENIVLLGASLFGYKNDNVLLEYLTKKTNKFVINAGFPGSRGAYAVSTAGSSDWDKLSFVNVADCIVSGNYQSIETAIGNLGSSYSYFLDRLASLKTLDLTKPTIIFLGYGNNDITKGSPIGDLWAKEQSLSTYDKTALLGALNYGMAKIMQAYPNVKVVVNTPIWRMIGGTVDPEGGTTGDPVAPYEYTNTLGLTFYQYLEAIETNCKRCGVRVFDTFRMGGRCVFNWNYYSVDTTHWNKAGFDLFSTALAEESKNI